MKSIYKYLSATALGIIAISSATAQEAQSGYFVEDYTYRFQMNPAIDNSKGYVSMPGLGNLNVGMHGNLGLKDVLYNVDGKTCLFTNPDVPAADVMKNIHKRNSINADLRETLLSVGFKGMGGYNTITLSARAVANARIPGSLFSLLKDGVTNQTYELTGMRAKATAFAEIALNHSHQLTDEVRIGATVKALLGAGNGEVMMDKGNVTLGKDNWIVESNATAFVNMKGFQWKTDVNSRTGHEYVSGASYDWDGLSGWGAAVDLGVVYNPKCAPDWEFSLAFLDLGFMHWNANVVASTQGTRYFETDRYSFNVDDDADNSFKNEWDKMRDDIYSLYELDDLGNRGSRTCGIGATMNTGIKYTLPCYKKLNFGLLNSTRFDGPFTWTDFRLSANIAPVKVLSGGINVGAGTYGVAFGWIANLHVTGFNLFVGMDHTLGKLAKQGIPLNDNTEVNVGLNFLF